MEALPTPEDSAKTGKDWAARLAEAEHRCTFPDCVRGNDVSARLILEIEVPDFNVDGTLENIADMADVTDVTVLDVVLDEWMRREVGVTFVTLPGEKNLNSDFDVHALTCRIVGARIEERQS